MRPPEPGGSFHDVQPDPSRVGGVAESPFVRLPNAPPLFLNRAARLRALAEGHTLAGYLRFLASIVDAQAGCCAALPPPTLPPLAQIAQRGEHAMPPLAVEQVQGAEFAATLSWLLAHVDLGSAPAEAQQARDALQARTGAEQAALAADVFGGAFPADRLAEAVFAAAAVQAHLARLAGQLGPAAMTPAAAGLCPACGGTPVSSVVVGWTQASKARYCACSLCGTLWNHVRIKCTACASTEGIAYFTIEGGSADIGVEACSGCRSYIKHMQQHKDAAIDPVADDVASYALDLLAREEGYRRAGLNPLFLTA